jgi:hypothetical protein
MGTAPTGVAIVAIKIKRHGHWHTIGGGRVHNHKFTARVHVRETAHYKATAQGARDSKSVKIAARNVKRKHKR